MILHYLTYLKANNLFPEEFTTFRFNSITRKDYDTFVMDPSSFALINSTCDITTKPPANSGLADNFKVAYSPAESFKKSIKRDASHFTTFKDGKYWDTWYRNTLATARAQDISEVLKPNHCPVTDDDVNLFRENQTFMHTVFDKTLQTDRGKKHLRDYERYYDAQSVYRNLNPFYTESTNAHISTSATLSYITSAKIESWKGTSEAFILHWQDQVRVHETLVPNDSHFSDH